MDIASRPADAVRSFHAAEGCADGQPRGNPANRLMEKTGVAGSQLTHQVVHSQFEGFRVFGGDNFSLAGLGDPGPVRAVELRVVIMLRDRFIDLFEYCRSLL